MKKKYFIAFLTLALLGGVTVSISEITKAKIENKPDQTESAPMKLEGISESQEYQNGIIIEKKVWSQEINETSEAELEPELEAQSDGQAGIGYGYQAGTPAK